MNSPAQQQHLLQMASSTSVPKPHPSHNGHLKTKQSHESAANNGKSYHESQQAAMPNSNNNSGSSNSSSNNNSYQNIQANATQTPNQYYYNQSQQTNRVATLNSQQSINSTGSTNTTFNQSSSAPSYSSSSSSSASSSTPAAAVAANAATATNKQVNFQSNPPVSMIASNAHNVNYAAVQQQPAALPLNSAQSVNNSVPVNNASQSTLSEHYPPNNSYNVTYSKTYYLIEFNFVNVLISSLVIMENIILILIWWPKIRNGRLTHLLAIMHPILSSYK